MKRSHRGARYYPTSTLGLSKPFHVSCLQSKDNGYDRWLWGSLESGTDNHLGNVNVRDGHPPNLVQEKLLYISRCPWTPSSLPRWGVTMRRVVVRPRSMRS